MDSESWLLVDSSGKIEEFSGSNEQPIELSSKPANEGGTSNSVNDNNNQLQLQAFKVFGTIGNMLNGNESIRSFTEIGRDLIEEHFGSLQKQLFGVASNVSSRSLSTFERVKMDLENAITAAVSEANEDEVSQKPLHTIATNSHGNNSHHKTDVETKQIWSLISVLRRSGKYPFMGHDFHSWFRSVCPVFEQELPHARPTQYLEGVKWYSEPSVAALIDECDISSYTTWYEIENALHEYFEAHDLRIKKFEAAAEVSTKLELLTS